MGTVTVTLENLGRSSAEELEAISQLVENTGFTLLGATFSSLVDRFSFSVAN